MKKNVVILGAGFVGVRCVQDLCKFLSEDEVKITLVDRRDFHLFHADLYEVATGFDKSVAGSCEVRFKNTVATPIVDLIDADRVDFVQDEVKRINPEKKMVTLLKGGSLKYDYLVCGLGTVVEDYGVSGVFDRAFFLKSLSDAIRLNCYLDRFFHELSESRARRDVYITVVGGGPTGVEFAAELSCALKILCKKYFIEVKRVHLQIVEGGSVLAGLSEEGNDVLLKRLNSLGVKVYFRRCIKRVCKRSVFVKFDDGVVDELASDVTVWTAGVKVGDVVARDLGDCERGGRILVNQFLQSERWSNIFAGGDNAFAFNKNGKGFPGLAQIAQKQGGLIAKNIRALMMDDSMKKFEMKKWHFVLPVGGKFAIWEVDGRVYKGFFVWLIRRLVFLRYLLGVLPFWKAVKKWVKTEGVFVAND